MHFLTRYLNGIYASRFLVALTFVVAFVLSLDLMANAHDVMDDQNGGVLAIARYALLRLPELASGFIGMASLMAGILTAATLIRHSELTAIWNSGISQFGIVLRLAPAALLIGLAQLALDEAVIPETSEQLRQWGVGEY